MKIKRTPWSYRKGNSFLHRLSAAIKLSFLLVISAASFFPNIYVLLSIAFILILLSFSARIMPWELLRGSRPIIIFLFFLLIIQNIEFTPFGFNFLNLEDNLFFILRILCAFSAGSLLFSVTTSFEIRKSLAVLEVSLGLKKANISLSISLMLAFLPQFFKTWEELNLAWKGRGGKNNFKKLKTLIPLTVENMMKYAADTALAMEARGKLC